MDIGQHSLRARLIKAGASNNPERGQRRKGVAVEEGGGRWAAGYTSVFKCFEIYSKAEENGKRAEKVNPLEMQDEGRKKTDTLESNLLDPTKEYSAHQEKKSACGQKMIVRQKCRKTWPQVKGVRKEEKEKKGDIYVKKGGNKNAFLTLILLEHLGSKENS